ncbi:MAG: hypothetical protein HY289_11155, partial [Planctomycetes bacterium]|nr:hypothetical protein [Planctomycetota bacterium]
FRADAAAVEGVPIPVWTTKAFCASWEQTLKSKPFVVDLRYYRKPVQGKDIKLKGKLENHLAVDLTDVWLIYDDRCFPIEGGLKSVREGPAPGPFVLSTSNEEVKNWVNLREGADQASEPRTWNSNPTSLIKTIMFHERSDTQRVLPNHLLRSIDLGWRIQEERPALATDRSVREAILFARVQHATGPSETVTTDPDLPLPTKLWLGDTPDPARSRPALIGQLNQDTYIRVILPVRPADE